MSDRLNVMFVVPNLRRGGAETQLIDLLNGLNSQRFGKSLVLFDEGTDQLDRVAIGPERVHHFPRKRKFDASIFRAVATLVDDEAIDVIHCTLQVSLLVAWAARIRSTRKPKLVTVIHTTKNVSIKNELLDRALYRWLFRSCQKIVFVCHAQAEHWQRRFPELKQKSAVIYNGVDTAKFSKDAVGEAAETFADEYGIPPGAPVLTCIAGFRPEKGHDILVRAFRDANVEGGLLVLAGEGPLRENVAGLVRDLGIEDRVIFTGNLADVRPLLAISTLSVLASTAVETFSIAMLESMSMEVPVLATDIGGLREAIFPGRTGELVAPGDGDALAKKIRDLLGDADHCARMGSTAREMVLSKFENSVMADETEELLRSLDRD